MSSNIMTSCEFIFEWAYFSVRLLSGSCGGLAKVLRKSCGSLVKVLRSYEFLRSASARLKFYIMFCHRSCIYIVSDHDAFDALKY